MANKRKVELLKALAAGTNEGRIPWTNTVQDRVFMAAFPNYAVQIRRTQSSVPGDLAYLITDRDPSYEYHLEVHNQKGTLIEDISEREFSKEADNLDAHSVLAAIYEQARRMALGVDEALDALLQEIARAS